MKTAVIAITDHGVAVGRKIGGALACDLYLPENISPETEGVERYSSSTKEFVTNIWPKYDALIFIMAMGIVTRIIKDHIRDKYSDPAVVVVDEMGRYAISALSGHEGGANRLAERVAFICHGDFVVTTGSEAIRTLIIGMGCRRGVSAQRLEETLLGGLKSIDRTLKEVRLIATVEDKGDEKGLIELSEKLQIPLKLIPKTLIKTVENNFEKSKLVYNTLGISSVAEPCAMLGGFRCQLLLKKVKMKETTIAIAEERFL